MISTIFVKHFDFDDFIDAQEDEETGSGERSEDQDSDAPSSPDRLSFPDRPASKQIGPPRDLFLQLTLDPRSC